MTNTFKFDRCFDLMQGQIEIQVEQNWRNLRYIGIAASDGPPERRHIGIGPRIKVKEYVIESFTVFYGGNPFLSFY